MSFSIRLDGADEMIKKLTTLEQMKRVRAVIQQEAGVLLRLLRKYPNKVYSPNPLIKTNERVRRGFFYHLKHGNITVPYKRGGGSSEKLGASWTVDTENQGWTAVIGNDTSYGELVQGWDSQVTRHKWSGWITEKGALDVKRPEIIANITAALEEEVNNVG